MWKGNVVSIHIAPRTSAPTQTVDEVIAVPCKGLEGDRYYSEHGRFSNKPGVDRQVALIYRGGLRAEILSGGSIRIGDEVEEI
jgi:hypothetical protein